MQERRAGRVARGHIDPSRDKCFKNPLVLAGYGVESDRGGGILRHHVRHGRQEHFQDSRILFKKAAPATTACVTSAPAVISVLTTAWFSLYRAARFRGVSPRESNAVTSAPASRELR